MQRNSALEDLFFLGGGIHPSPLASFSLDQDLFCCTHAFVCAQAEREVNLCLLAESLNASFCFSNGRFEGALRSYAAASLPNLLYHNRHTWQCWHHWHLQCTMTVSDDNLRFLIMMWLRRNLQWCLDRPLTHPHVSATVKDSPPQHLCF